ncbi:ammonia channel protein AmtB [Anaerotaenia torta]|uniref:hypothetical protein n=1 Tax=Anaerotaenia torta TaxID=433293 RepID=UPI003D25929F
MHCFTPEWNGLIYGEIRLFAVQAASILITIAFAGIATFAILSVIKLFIPLRVTQAQEAQGLDLTEHGEMAYPAFNGLD